MGNLISTGTLEIATDTEIIITTTTGTSSVFELGTTSEDIGTTTAVAPMKAEGGGGEEMLLGGGSLDYQMITAVLLLGWFLLVLWKFLMWGKKDEYQKI
jgi:hypothetical protein